VSQAVTGFGVEGQGWDDAVKGQKWESAATVAATVVEAWIANRTKEAVVLNVNVPNLDVADIKGWRRTGVGQIVPRSMATAEMEAKEGHHGSYYVRMTYGDTVPMDFDSDGGAVENGEVSITYLSRFDDVSHHGTDDIHDALTGLVGNSNILHS
jgi:broad specificity polyphosphatase/5'/3'-nucleotidase SurE